MGFKVSKTCCDQCLFSNNKIVSDARRNEVLQGCTASDSHFICHKFTIEQLEGRLSESEADVCCNGFYNRFTTNLIRIAQRLNVVEFVDFPEAKK